MIYCLRLLCCCCKKRPIENDKIQSKGGHSDGLDEQTDLTSIVSWSSDASVSASVSSNFSEANEKRSDNQKPRVYVIVTVPKEIQDSGEFFIMLGSKLVKVCCPVGTKPGTRVRFFPPEECQPNQTQGNQTRITAPRSCQLVLADDFEYRVNLPKPIQAGGTLSLRVLGADYKVKCPVEAKQTIRVPNLIPKRIIPDIRVYTVKVPKGAKPGDIFVAPIGKSSFCRAICPRQLTSDSMLCTLPESICTIDKNSNKNMVFFEIASVGKEIEKGEIFSVSAMGMKTKLKAPQALQPHQKLRFQLPLDTSHQNRMDDEFSESNIGKRWTKIIRINDKRFQWECIGLSNNEPCAVDSLPAFVPQITKFPRKFPFVSLRPTNNATLSSSVSNVQGKKLANCTDLLLASELDPRGKDVWFEARCQEWLLRETSVRVHIRRSKALQDTLESVGHLKDKKELLQPWKLHDVDRLEMEMMTDPSEWFDVVGKELLNPELGLWKVRETDGTFFVNPKATSPTDLDYFRLLGRMLGKAVLESRPFAPAKVLAPYIWKLLMGYPVEIEDMRALDPEGAKRLECICSCAKRKDAKTIAALNLTMTWQPPEDHFLWSEIEDLEAYSGSWQRGSETDVSLHNHIQYVHGYMKHVLLGAFQYQFRHLLGSFQEIVPLEFVQIYTPEEFRQRVITGVSCIDETTKSCQREVS